MNAIANTDSPAPKISVMILTRNRVDVLRKSVASVLRQQFQDFELVVLDDASDVGDTASAIAAEFADGRIRAYRSTRTLGVAGGRNYLMERSRGEFLVAIDDDAQFVRDDSLDQVFAVLNAQPDIGALAFRIANLCGSQRSANVPFSRTTLLRNPDAVLRPALVSYFVGCGHALRRSIVQQFGGYRGDMVFGEEELDLAYRIVRAGCSIAYVPSIEVDHSPRPSVVGNKKMRRSSELFYHVRNRAYLAYRYLPWKYAVPYVSIWMLRYAIGGLREHNFSEFLRGTLATPQFLRGVEREVLNRAALAYLTKHGGRLWY